MRVCEAKVVRVRVMGVRTRVRVRGERKYERRSEAEKGRDFVRLTDILTLTLTLTSPSLHPHTLSLTNPHAHARKSNSVVFTYKIHRKKN